MKTINTAAVGIGLRAPHYQTLLSSLPDLGFLEIHSENYFNPHSKNHFYLQQLAESYALSFHGIGLSLGSSEPVSNRHLQQLKQLVDRFQPALVSDHLSWSSLQGQFFNDLLPIPYTKEALSCFINNVNQVQDYLKRQILIENPSSYLQYKDNDMSEAEFINEIAKQSGCAILLDLNNVYVSASNHQFSITQYLNMIDPQRVQEIHLAGFSEKKVNGSTLLIDTHSTFVSEEVWHIYRHYISSINNSAVTLIEWDANIPALETLLGEHNKAQNIRQGVAGGKHHEA